MSETSSAVSEPSSVVAHREVLRGAIVDLEAALAGPAFRQTRSWASSVAEAIRKLEEAFVGHLHVTEGPDGLYDDLLRIAPRLDSRILKLRADHVEIESALTKLLDEVDGRLADTGPVDDEHIEAWHAEGTQLLVMLVRHRQRGIEMTYEAYNGEFGGD